MKLDEAAKKRALKRYLDGEESVLQIAAAFGVSDRTIARLVRAAGHAHTRSPKGIHDAAGLAHVKALYAEHKNLTIVAEKIGLSPRSVKSALLRAGVKPRGFREAQKFRRRRTSIRLNKRRPADIRPYR